VGIFGKNQACETLINFMRRVVRFSIMGCYFLDFYFLIPSYSLFGVEGGEWCMWVWYLEDLCYLCYKRLFFILLIHNVLCLLSDLAFSFVCCTVACCINNVCLFTSIAGKFCVYLLSIDS